MDRIARNRILPQLALISVFHTYWHTCDFDVVLQSSRPCVLERLDIRAPGNGTVRHVDPSEDGSIAIEGPPGLVWTFGHVTPVS